MKRFFQKRQGTQNFKDINGMYLDTVNIKINSLILSFYPDFKNDSKVSQELKLSFVENLNEEELTNENFILNMENNIGIYNLTKILIKYGISMPFSSKQTSNNGWQKLKWNNLFLKLKQKAYLDDLSLKLNDIDTLKMKIKTTRS